MYHIFTSSTNAFMSLVRVETFLSRHILLHVLLLTNSMVFQIHRVRLKFTSERKNLVVGSRRPRTRLRK